MERQPTSKSNETPESVLFITPDYIRAEVVLENIGYFTPSSKRIKHILTKEKITGQRTNPDGTKTALKVVIIGTGKYGLPITSDLDYYRALLKMLDEIVDRDGLLPQPITIPIKKLIRYTGKAYNARESREVKDWIRRNRFTGVQGFVYQADKGDYVEIAEEPLFPKYRLRGERMEDGEIAEINHVWLAPWFVSNYLRGYIRPVDFAFYQRLRKPIAKSLSPLLETGWYASNGKAYAKSYRDLCHEFLLRQEPYLTHIKKQLDPSHRELQNEHFLEKWDYRRAANQTDYIITWWPGPKFFDDQQARATRKQLADHIDRGSKHLVAAYGELSDPQQRLLNWIIETCGDEENAAAYRKVIRDHHAGLIESALGETRQAKREQRIRTTAGKFFMDTLHRLAALRAQASRMG